jgi:hypothetical protein
VRTHLLRVAAPAEVFAPLFAAAREAGLRMGWLELAPPECVPPSLERAAACGALRAVAVGGGRAVAVKPRRGAPVLRDLVREHFAGCGAVLGVGELDAPLLDADGDGWRVSAAGGGRRLSTAELLAELRRPRPFSPR